MRTVLIVGVVVLMVGTGLTPALFGEAAAQQSQPETDNTITRIAVGPNGTAEWTVQVRTRLDTSERVQEYEAFQDRIRTNSSAYLDPFRVRMQGVVARAANATGREMQADGFVIETNIQEVPRRWGIVTFRFTWTNFAARSDGRLVVGDVFQGGFFLARNDSLEIRSPATYRIAEVSPTPTDRADDSVTWFGRVDFADEQPRVVFASINDSGTGEGDSTPSPSPVSSAGNGNFGLLFGVVLLALLVGVAAYYGYQRRSGADTRLADESEQRSRSTTQAEEPVLTDEERVVKLLEERDGRVRQADIAEAFDWSPSKTSRVIGSLVDEGAIEKLQLGRENLIDLGDEEA